MTIRNHFLYSSLCSPHQHPPHRHPVWGNLFQHFLATAFVFTLVSLCIFLISLFSFYFVLISFYLINENTAPLSPPHLCTTPPQNIFSNTYWTNNGLLPLSFTCSKFILYITVPVCHFWITRDLFKRGHLIQMNLWGFTFWICNLEWGVIILGVLSWLRQKHKPRSCCNILQKNCGT